jgi:hypothetical protein
LRILRSVNLQTGEVAASFDFFPAGDGCGRNLFCAWGRFPNALSTPLIRDSDPIPLLLPLATSIILSQPAQNPLRVCLVEEA